MLDKFELHALLIDAQDDVQAQITRHGADFLLPHDLYDPWQTEDIALAVYRYPDSEGMTLGQVRSMVEGLGLYMIQGGRAREARFQLLVKDDDSSTKVGAGDLWLIL